MRADAVPHGDDENWYVRQWSSIPPASAGHEFTTCRAGYGVMTCYLLPGVNLEDGNLTGVCCLVCPQCGNMFQCKTLLPTQCNRNNVTGASMVEAMN